MRATGEETAAAEKKQQMAIEAAIAAAGAELEAAKEAAAAKALIFESAKKAAKAEAVVKAEPKARVFESAKKAAKAEAAVKAELDWVEATKKETAAKKHMAEAFAALASELERAKEDAQEKSEKASAMRAVAADLEAMLDTIALEEALEEDETLQKQATLDEDALDGPSDDDFSWKGLFAACLDMWREVVKYLCRIKASVFFAVAGSVALIAISSMPGENCVVRESPGRNNSITLKTICLDGDSYLVMALYLYALLLMANDGPPDLVMLGFTLILVFADIIKDKDAWSGFCSTSVLAIGALLVVARALEETRAIEAVLLPILGTPKSHVSALLRLTLPVVVLSAFLNNTPIVAMLMSVCEQWAARSNLSVKVLLMPLSFASLLGGMCSLIGTSTNLILNALIEADPNPPIRPFTLFQFSGVGFPAAIAGCIYMAIFVPLIFTARQAPAAVGTAWSLRRLWRKLRYGADANGAGSGSHPVRLTTSVNPAVSTQSSTHEIHSVEHSRVEMVSVDMVAAEAPPESSAGFGSRGSPRYVLEVLVTRKCTLLLNRSPADLGTLVGQGSACVPRVLIRADLVLPLGPLSSPTLLVQAGDRLLVRCLAPAVPVLRKVRGLVIRPDLYLESRRATAAGAVKRVLVEATIASGSPLVALTLAEALASESLSGAKVWAIREMTDYKPPGANASRHASPRLKSTPGARPSSPGLRPVDSSTALMQLEADQLPSAMLPMIEAPLSSSATYASQATPKYHLIGADYEQNATMRMWYRDAGVIREFCAETSTAYASLQQQPMFGMKPLLPSKLEMPLSVGAMLLVEAPNNWVWAHRATSCFARLERIADNSANDTTARTRLFGVFGKRARPLKNAEIRAMAKRCLALASLLVLLVLSAFDIVDLFPLSIALGYFVVSIQIITLDQAWRSISYRLVLCVACSFGPGKALTNTGVADFAGVALLSLQGLGSFGFLLAIHLFTSLLTSIVSNSAAVITIYSVLRSVSVPGVTSEQMMVCMLLGASTDFMTPIGYQTNLMVYKRGGYAFSDYARVGVGLTIVVGCVVSGASLAFM